MLFFKIGLSVSLGLWLLQSVKYCWESYHVADIFMGSVIAGICGGAVGYMWL